MWSNDQHVDDDGSTKAKKKVKTKKKGTAEGHSKDTEEDIPLVAVDSTPELALKADLLLDGHDDPGSTNNKTVKEPPCWMNKQSWEDLEKDQCFHGSIPWEDVTSMLKKEGDFLLRRYDDENGFANPVLTVVWEKKVCNYCLISKRDDGGKNVYSVDGTVFKESPRQIVRHHFSAKVPIVTSAKLLNPISKQEWELSNEQLALVHKIGEGAFGEVWSGTLNKYERVIPVAIKLMKMTAHTKANLEQMHTEARIHRQYNHRNLVRMFGVVFTDSDVRIVMELVGGGSLEKFVRNNNCSTLQKASFSYDIAAGLSYLHARRFMHRDIAARNCLIGECGKIAKLSDFGLSVEGLVFKIQPDEKIPVRWQSPEVLVDRVYYIASDVWSYGILLWEIHNDGAPPFTGIENKEIKAKIKDPTFRPEISFKTPYPEIYTIMRLCWQTEPNKRVAMRQVEAALRKYSIHAICPKEHVVLAKECSQKSAPRRLKNSRKSDEKTTTKKKGKTPSLSPASKAKRGSREEASGLQNTQEQDTADSGTMGVEKTTKKGARSNRKSRNSKK